MDFLHFFVNGFLTVEVPCRWLTRRVASPRTTDSCMRPRIDPAATTTAKAIRAMQIMAQTEARAAITKPNPVIRMGTAQMAQSAIMTGFFHRKAIDINGKAHAIKNIRNHLTACHTCDTTGILSTADGSLHSNDFSSPSGLV